MAKYREELRRASRLAKVDESAYIRRAGTVAAHKPVLTDHPYLACFGLPLLSKFISPVNRTVTGWEVSATL